MADQARKIDQLRSSLEALRGAGFVDKIARAEQVAALSIQVLEEHDDRLDQLEAIVANLRRRAARG